VRQTKYTAADSCDGGISVLNHCLSWSKFVNTHLSHSRQWFNIHLFTTITGWLIELFRSFDKKYMWCLLWQWTRLQNNARLEDFDRKRTLGTGAFGRVLLVKHKKSEQFYALKVLDKHQVNDASFVRMTTPVYFGYLTEGHKQMLQRVLNRANRSRRGFTPYHYDLDTLAESAQHDLFRHSCHSAHCLNHLYTTKPKPPGAMRLRPRGHDFELPIVKFEFNKRNFIVRSLFLYVWLCVYRFILVRLCCDFEYFYWGLLHNFSVMRSLFIYCCKHVRLTCV